MIIITSQRGTILVTDGASKEWYGSVDLVGSSLLGMVAPTERLTALRFIERLAANPGTPMNGQFQLIQRSGKVTVCTALGACTGDALAIQFRRRSHGADLPDESLAWISEESPAIDWGTRTLVVAMIAGAISRTVSGSEVAYDHTTVSVSFPTGSTRDDIIDAHRRMTERSSFDAQLGAQTVAVAGEVRSVHFDDTGITMLSPDGLETGLPWTTELRR